MPRPLRNQEILSTIEDMKLILLENQKKIETQRRINVLYGLVLIAWCVYTFIG